MRILAVNKFGYRRGGAENYLFNLGDALRAAGHEVEYFFMQHPHNLTQRFDTHFPPQMEFRAGASPAMVWRTIWNRVAARGLARVLDEFKPDIVHLHNIRYHLSASICRLLRKRHQPTVQTLHDYGSLCPAHHLFRAAHPCDRCLRYGLIAAPLSRCLFGSYSRSLLGAAAEARDRFAAWTRRAVDYYICPSRFLRDKMAAAGMDRLVYLPHFVTIPDRPAARDGGYALYLGRLDYEKGVDILLKATAGLPELQVKIAGSGSMAAGLEQLVHREDMKGRVAFWGQLDATRAMEVLSHAYMLILPSRAYENAPLAVYEALAAGVPVISSAPGGAVELLEGGAGITFPAGDVTALRRSMADLLAQPDLAAEMGEKARRKAGAEWTVDRHIEGLMGIYQMAMGSKR